MEPLISYCKTHNAVDCSRNKTRGETRLVLHPGHGHKNYTPEDIQRAKAIIAYDMQCHKTSTSKGLPERGNGASGNGRRIGRRQQYVHAADAEHTPFPFAQDDFSTVHPWLSFLPDGALVIVLVIVVVSVGGVVPTCFTRSQVLIDEPLHLQGR
jgi:hypothetical protein